MNVETVATKIIEYAPAHSHFIFNLEPLISLNKNFYEQNTRIGINIG